MRSKVSSLGKRFIWYTNLAMGCNTVCWLTIVLAIM